MKSNPIIPETDIHIDDALTLDDVETYLRRDVLPTGVSSAVRDYVHVLREISLMIQGGKTPAEIKNHLVIVYGITRRKASMMYVETFNYYNIGTDLSPAAVRAYFANEMIRYNRVLMQSNPTPETIINVRDSQARIASLLGADRPEKDDTDAALMPHKVIYTMTYRQAGLGEAERADMARLIASLPVPESVKQQACREAGITQDDQPIITLDPDE